jgi:ribosome maturation factor RimP
MGLEGTSLWSTIEGIAQEEGVELFDLELPVDTRRGGTLRVFITRPASASQIAVERSEPEVEGSDVQRSGISFGDCVRVSKRILDLDEQQEVIPGNCNLEVSSPGINRKLRLPAHFGGAVGERVRVKFRSTETGATVVVTGIVREVSSSTVQVTGEGKSETVSILFSEIKEARVDFNF